MAKTGRKPRFESAKEMEDRIDAYFEQCKENPYTMNTVCRSSIRRETRF